MSGRRSAILAAARRVTEAWEDYGDGSEPLTAALVDLTALVGTPDYPGPEEVTYLVLREDFGNWLVRAATDEEARQTYAKEVPHLGYRGIFRDTGFGVSIPDRSPQTEEEPS